MGLKKKKERKSLSAGVFMHMFVTKEIYNIWMFRQSQYHSRMDTIAEWTLLMVLSAMGCNS